MAWVVLTYSCYEGEEGFSSIGSLFLLAGLCLLLVLALISGLTREQIFLSRIGLRNLMHSRSTFEIRGHDKPVVWDGLVTKGKIPTGICSEFIAVFVPCHNVKKVIACPQPIHTLCGEFHQVGRKERISTNGLSPGLASGSIFPFSCSRHWIKGMRRVYVRELARGRDYDNREYRPPIEFGRGVSGILEINHESNVPLLVRGNHKVSNDAVFAANSDVGALRYSQGLKIKLIGFPGQQDYTESQGSICEYKSGTDLRPKKLLVVVGCLVCLGSLICLFKVLDSVYLNSSINVNRAVAKFFACLLIFMFGGWLIFVFFSLP